MAMNPRLMRPLARAGTAPPVPVNASLVLNFDGAFTDESVNGLTVTAVGNAAITTSVTKFGSGSLALDGSGSWAEVANASLFNFGAGDFTLEAWVYPTNPQSACSVFSKRGTGEYELALVLYVYQGSTYLVVSADGMSWALNDGGTAAVAANQWGHIALVRAGSNFSVYWNGVLSQSFTSDTAIYDSTETLNIGGGGVVNQDFFGYIDGVRVTKAALYCSDFTPPTAPPTPTVVPPCCPAQG